MSHHCPASKLQRAAVLLTAILGAASLFAGSGVLLGVSTRNHPVLLPLVAFNTFMGLVYVATALRIRIDAQQGFLIARVLFVVNIAVLLALVAYGAAGGTVARDSYIAMSVRVAFFAAVSSGLGYVVRPSRAI